MVTLEQGEEILGYFRKHWLHFVLQTLPLLFGALVPFLFPGLLRMILPISLERVASAFWFFAFLWLLFIWVWFFVLWTKYYFDVWVLTSRRIIFADQRSLFSRQVSTIDLEKIQDIMIDVEGVIETFLGYGTLRVQSAGEAQEFVLNDAMHPESVKQKVIAAQRAQREAHLARQAMYIRNAGEV